MGYAPHAFLYSRKRDRIERQFLTPHTGEGFDSPGKLLLAEPTVRGAHFYFERAELEVSFLAADFVRVDWFPGIPPVPYGISRHDWPEVEKALEKTDEGWSVSGESLKVTVGVDGRQKWSDSAGVPLREELPPRRKNEGWVHQARLRKEESLYGLGEREYLPVVRFVMARNCWKNGERSRRRRAVQGRHAGRLAGAATPPFRAAGLRLENLTGTLGQN